MVLVVGRDSGCLDRTTHDTNESTLSRFFGAHLSFFVLVHARMSMVMVVDSVNVKVSPRSSSCVVAKRVIRKFVAVMRNKLAINKKMLSVVSAGAAAGVGGMDRLRGRTAARDLAAARDRQVRLHSVHTDIALNLPPSIALPDGEDHPFSSSRLHIRDSEQESEIYQKCIKPPPNRTVLESESPPPYRSSSAGLLGSIGSSSSNSSDWSGGSAPLVMRCHSMSSTSKRPEAGTSGQKTDFIQRTVKIFTGKKSQPPPAPSLPVVVVPTRPRQTCEQQQQNLSGRSNKPSV